ncbi:hypothetical protein GOP47_0007605 [Adiantum capillus-veneris]|uniref:Uncharacterized protein n=1 Tax=Adiantum capillus-veneris TaxID=13818 RepID=A0A9D4V1M5_ADICA|nr:hypothetical protein GOP47_0007605 [Adiantum capillus-veneris]
MLLLLLPPSLACVLLQLMSNSLKRFHATCHGMATTKILKKSIPCTNEVEGKPWSNKMEARMESDKESKGKDSYMMMKDYSCPWWTPDPSTGFWSAEDCPPLPRSNLNSLDIQIWVRSEEAA